LTDYADALETIRSVRTVGKTEHSLSHINCRIQTLMVSSHSEWDELQGLQLPHVDRFYPLSDELDRTLLWESDVYLR
jgi:hypothetical protein